MTTDPWAHVPPGLRQRYDEQCGSIPGAVLRAAQLWPDAEAIVDGELRLSFADLERTMVDAVRATIALGVAPGDRVAVWSPNTWQWIVAALGIQGAGGILVPINTRFKADEAAHVIRTSGARAAIVATGFLGTDYAALIRANEDLADLPIVSFDLVGPSQSWDTWWSGGRDVPESAAVRRIAAVGPDDLSDIMFTSGTTGAPKGVLVTHGQSLRAHGWLALVMQFRAGDRYLIVPPFFHTFGYKAGWMACVVHGVTVLPVVAFDVDQALRMIESERITIFEGPPTIFTDLLDSPNRSQRDLSSIRITMPAATSVPPELVRRLRDELGAEVTHTSYGLTEATSLVTTAYPGDSFDDVVGTSGRAAWDVEVRVVDAAGQAVPTGCSGEVWCKGYNVTRGYWEDDAATRSTITPDGWLRTGDIGILDERGYLRITDRLKDMIIVGGFNVYPAEVERLLAEHPGVLEIAVVGVPDDRLGEVPVAFVVTEPEFDPETFRSWARERVANTKVPREVYVVDHLPRNASAKVVKHELRSRATPPR